MDEGLNSVDRHIIASTILGVDITEVYSPERVNEVARKCGLTPGSSLDLTNGWDFTKPEHRRAAWKKIKDEDPYLVIGSPPCTFVQHAARAEHLQQQGQARMDGKVQTTKGRSY